MNRTKSVVHDWLKIFRCCLGIGLLLSASAAATAVATNEIEPQLLRINYQSQIDQSQRQFLVYLPKGYAEKSHQKWPLLLFLHGNGERGNGLDELDFTQIHGPLYEAWIQKRDLPFIMLVPQLHMFDMGTVPYIAGRKKSGIPQRLKQGVPPRSQMAESTEPIAPAKPIKDMAKIPPLLPDGWERAEQDLLAMLVEVQKRFRVDDKRLYLSGISYGGFGSWFLASKHPGVFAAVAPVVGWGHPDFMEPIAKVKTPLWVFAAGRDSAVNKDFFYPGIEKLRQLGHNNVRFSVLEQAEHDAWRQIYAGSDLFDWLLQQKLP
jgi:predicted peptidase